MLSYNSLGLLDYHIRRKTPFTATFTKNTLKIESQFFNAIFSGSHLTFSELGFINKVKTHARKVEEDGVIYSPADVDYSAFTLEYDKLYTNCIELDINAAYWQIAKEEAIISEAIYREGLLKEKRTRLIALGSLATIKRKYYYDGTPESLEKATENIYDAKLRNFWFCISHRLGVLMKKCIAEIGEENFYFFWVDALFCKKEVKKQVEQFFKKEGFGVKAKQVERLIVKIPTEQECREMNIEKMNDYLLILNDGKRNRPFFIPKPFNVVNLQNYITKVKDFKNGKLARK